MSDINALDNPLSIFSSYSCVISLYVLTKEELANPDLYRKTDPKYLIARTGGLGTDGDNVVATLFERNLGKKVEYFLDDLEIDSIISQTVETRQTNATIIRFKLLEPYSMGVFLQALQFTVQASDSSRISYIDPAYVLKIEFKGFNDSGEYVLVPGTTRYLPIKLTGIRFNVSASGSEYEINAVAWNDQSFADEIQFIDEDLSLSGKNVFDFLKNGISIDDGEKVGLEGYLNQREQTAIENNQKEKADKFLISFPDQDTNREPTESTEDEGTATTQNLDNFITVNQGQGIDAIISQRQDLENKISQSNIVLDKGSAGTRSDGDVVDDFTEFDGGRVSLRNDSRLMQFSRGIRIQDIIEEVILLSEYAKDLANLNEKKPDNLGYKEWFRIESQVIEQATAPDAITGKTPKLYIYSVVPYKVESSRFLGPLGNLTATDELRKRAPKSYDYIYTGKNDDIINFDLQFNLAFFQGLQRDLGTNSQKNQEGSRVALSGPAAESERRSSEVQTATELIAQGFQDLDEQLNQPLSEFSTIPTDELQDSESSSDLPGIIAETAPTVGSNTGRQGGSANIGDTDELTTIARNFNEIIVNGVDLIMLDIEIWGDPFYIVDSGIGNYNAPASDNPFITNDNTLDYQYYEPVCLLNFKTPLDYNNEGKMDFPDINGETVSQFSGLYRIIIVKNKIISNKFTQELRLVRLRNQEKENGSSDFLQTTPTLPLIAGTVFSDPIIRSASDQGTGAIV